MPVHVSNELQVSNSEEAFIQVAPSVGILNVRPDAPSVTLYN